VKLTFHGVRGSTPVSGTDFSRTGGHTSCIAVALGDALPTLVLDAGTGLQRLAREFGSQPFVGTILLTHMHWDHLQGLPFFPPGDRDDARATLMQPAQGEPVALLSRAMSPPHFPIGPDGLRGQWQHVGLEPGKHDIEQFEVVATDVQHKGGRTYGYRVSANGVTFAYVPDALDVSRDAILGLAEGADLLVRGAPFLAAEHERAELFGHGTVEASIDVAREAGARLIVTHHGPMRTDDAVDEIGERFGVAVAREGLTITL